MGANLPRVAFVLTELRPGGMERLVVHLATSLKDRGVVVLVLCLHEAGQLAPLLAEREVPVVALHSSGGKDIKTLYRLWRQLRQFCPTCVHLHDYTSLPYAAIANLFSSDRAPLLFTAHGLLYEGFEPLKKRLRFFSRFLTSISAVSSKVAQRHKDYLAWGKEIPVISNGVPEVSIDSRMRCRVREELGLDEDTFLFLAVGNPRPEKAFEDLLSAAGLLRDQGYNFYVAIAGTLTESDYCRNLLQQLDSMGLQNHCHFLGFRDDTAALYAAADAFVLSSRSEGLPMVILEAMTAGMPIVSTRVGGIADAVSGHALLVDPQNPEQLSAAMSDVLNQRDEITVMANEGKKHVEKVFGVEGMAQAYLAWYESALNREE